jgi:hypothetical protein
MGFKEILNSDKITEVICTRNVSSEDGRHFTAGGVYQIDGRIHHEYIKDWNVTLTDCLYVRSECESIGFGETEFNLHFKEK